MPQHGWVRDLYWHVEEITPTSVAGLVVPTNGMRAAFPFRFELRLRYQLGQRRLKLDAMLANTGAEAFPYALGFHPYLRAPLGEGLRSECLVRLPGGVRVQSNDGFRTLARTACPSRVVACSEAELAGSILLTETRARSLTLEDAAARLATTVSVEESEQDFPVWVVWSASPEAPYVCLEPWTDAPNALNRAGTRSIAPGATHRYRMTIGLQEF
jgi:galactose mutarotase-like enzyme